MTKIYQRPFSEVVKFQLIVDSIIMIFSIWVVCKYIIFSGILVDYAGWIALGILSPGILAVWYSILGKYFYIVLHDDRIVVQNYFLPFFRINRNYKEISKVRFWMPTPNQWGVESIEISKVGRKRGGLFLGIISVNKKRVSESYYKTSKNYEKTIIDIGFDGSYVGSGGNIRE